MLKRFKFSFLKSFQLQVASSELQRCLHQVHVRASSTFMSSGLHMALQPWTLMLQSHRSSQCDDRSKLQWCWTSSCQYSLHSGQNEIGRGWDFWWINSIVQMALFTICRTKSGTKSYLNDGNEKSPVIKIFMQFLKTFISQTSWWATGCFRTRCCLKPGMGIIKSDQHNMMRQCMFFIDHQQE